MPAQPDRAASKRLVLPRPARAERHERGRAVREQVPWEVHAEIGGAVGREPIKVLRAQDDGRIAELVPLRWRRMCASPFTFYRGAAAVMGSDLATVASTGLETQVCGDAHLSNFGVFAAPDRRLVFDVNDFDETDRGSFEWDVKRLATSLVIAADNNGLPAKAGHHAARAAVTAYRDLVVDLAGRDPLDVWYFRVEVDALRSKATKAGDRKRLDAVAAQAARRDRLGALSKLTETVDGARRLKQDPPLIVRLGTDDDTKLPDVTRFLSDYLQTLPDGHRLLPERYALRDVARKVVGVGSVGTECLVAFFETGDGEAVFLQLKQAGPSVLETAFGPGPVPGHARRVVTGQHLMQSAPDVFLGWASTTGGTDFYVRQLWDGKASAAVEQMGATALEDYGRLCGAVLARAHARAGDAAQIAGYLDDGAEFAQAVGEFARRYAARNAADLESARSRIADGEISVQTQA